MHLSIVLNRSLFSIIKYIFIVMQDRIVIELEQEVIIVVTEVEEVLTLQ